MLFHEAQVNGLNWLNQAQAKQMTVSWSVVISALMLERCPELLLDLVGQMPYVWAET